MKSRFYVHGDEHEDLPGKFYCASCELFTNKEHFNIFKHAKPHLERYHICMLKLDTKIKGSKKHRRPTNPHNLFTQTHQIDTPAKKKSGPFYRWLQKQVERIDGVGDLARNARADESFPAETSSLIKLQDYYKDQSFDDESLDTLKEAHSEFRSK